MTTKEIEIQLALGSLTEKMKMDLADSPNTPKKMLTILSRNGYWLVRSNVASNPNTPKEVLTKLSKDKNSYVKYWATINLNGRKENDNHFK